MLRRARRRGRCFTGGMPGKEEATSAISTSWEREKWSRKKPGRLTFRAVNAALAAAGAAEVLVKGDGYFYFMEGDAHCWPATMVYVTRLNDLTVEQWIGEWRSLRANWLSRKS